MTRKYIVEFNKDFKGLRCVGVLYNGHRCGYVGVPISHPLYNFHYIDKLPKELLYYWEKVKTRPVGKRGVVDLFCCDFSNPHVRIIFDVHGGITFEPLMRITILSQQIKSSGSSALTVITMMTLINQKARSMLKRNVRNLRNNL